MTISGKKRELVIKLRLKGWSNKKIANELDIHCTSVGRLIKLYQKTGDVRPRKKQGRTRLLHLREERFLKYKMLGHQSAVFLANETSNIRKRFISPETIRRSPCWTAWKEKGKKTTAHNLAEKKKVQFCTGIRRKDESFWESVIFSDEACFKIVNDEA